MDQRTPSANTQPRSSALISFLRPLHIVDVVNISFYTFLSILSIVYHSRVPEWRWIVLVNTAGTILVYAISYLSRDRIEKVVYLRLVYSIITIAVVFKELYLMVHPIHPTDYDQSLIAIDYYLFGVHPTRWIYQFAHPLITEILQIVYTSFYLLPVILGIELAKRKDYQAFEETLFIIVYGFYLSYIGYFLVPAVGPRFTLHDFHAISQELPGLWLTDILREIVNIGESIPAGTSSPINVVQRDVFPSGHTDITLIVMYLAAKYHSKIRWPLWIAGTLLIIATVYLRYHYVIDLIGGALFMLLTIKSAPILSALWKRWTSRA